MSGAGKHAQTADGCEGDSDGKLGEKVHDDMKIRQAQANGNSTTCLEVNITKFGREFHGIEKGETVEVEVREHGIAIRPIDLDPEP